MGFGSPNGVKPFAGLAVSMAGQEVLLVQDGLWSLQTGLPLHLCGMMGLCSLPLLWLRPRGLLCFSLLLGAPCALLALCFPALWPSARSDRLVGGVRTGRKPKTADPVGSAENDPLGQRLWVAGAAVQRLAARQLSVFTSGANRNAAGMAGAAGMGLLSVLPLAAGHGVSSMGVRLLERPAAAADRPYCCRK